VCKCLFSKVTVQAITESDNKAAYCHTPVLQRHRPFRGRCLYCQTHHFFHRLVCRKHLRFLIAWRITLFSDRWHSSATATTLTAGTKWISASVSTTRRTSRTASAGWGKSIHMVIFQKIIRTSVLYITR